MGNHRRALTDGIPDLLEITFGFIMSAVRAGASGAYPAGGADAAGPV